MADNLTVARPYAKAAFDFAYQNNAIEKWKIFLFGLAKLVSTSNVVNLSEVNSDKTTVEFISNVLNGIMDEYNLNFVKIIVENHRLALCNEIVDEFIRISNQKENIAKAEVISAVKIEDSDLNKIKLKLESKYNCSVTLENKIDSTLIAGLIIKIGDKVIDASIRSRLDKLSNSLQS